LEWNAASMAKNVVGLVFVAAFAPDEGEQLGAVASGSKDSVLNTAQVSLRYPTGNGGETAVEFAIHPSKLHDVFAADLPVEQAAVMAATQRPVAGLAFSEPNGLPPGGPCLAGRWSQWATRPPALMLSARSRSAPGPLSPRSRGSHVIMLSQPHVVAEVILSAIEHINAERTFTASIGTKS
jgi:hypothetical protein